jgi:hypothetical protein
MSRLRLNKIATPATPAAGKGELFYSSTLSPAAFAIVDESGLICRVGGLTTKDYRLVNAPDASRSILNGTTSFTPTAGVTALYVECVGAGGAGGGAAAGTAAASFGNGGGGGGGGWSSLWATTAVAGAHASIAVGAGGTAGTTGGNAGNGGGDTTFTNNAAAAICVGKGGSGGTSGATQTLLGGGYAGGAGGVAGTGDRSIQGEDGDYPIICTVAVATGAVSGKGGKAAMGYGGGGALIKVGGAGNAGRVYGGGGSGGLDSAATTRVGGVGGNGIIRIWEYA